MKKFQIKSVCPRDILSHNPAKIFVISLFLFFFTVSLFAAPIREENRITDEKARLSYSFGMIMGSNLRSAELELDYTAFAEGMRDILEDRETLFSELEAMEIVEIALQEAMDRQVEGSRIAENNFLSENRRRDGVQSTLSGLQYEILHETDGEKPQENSVVRVHYEGRMLDDTLFDASYSEPDGAIIPLEMVIPGWVEAIMLMSVGSKYKVYIPSNLAYGSEGIFQIIPPFATLVFTIELLEIIKEDEYEEEEV